MLKENLMFDDDTLDEAELNELIGMDELTESMEEDDGQFIPNIINTDIFEYTEEDPCLIQL